MKFNSSGAELLVVTSSSTVFRARPLAAINGYREDAALPLAWPRAADRQDLVLVKNDPAGIPLHVDIGQPVMAIERTPKPTVREAQTGDRVFREERTHNLYGSDGVLAAHRGRW